MAQIPQPIQHIKSIKAVYTVKKIYNNLSRPMAAKFITIKAIISPESMITGNRRTVRRFALKQSKS